MVLAMVQDAVTGVWSLEGTTDRITPIMLFFPMVTSFTWSRREEEGSLEGVRDVLWPQGSASVPGLGGLSGVSPVLPLWVVSVKLCEGQGCSCGGCSSTLWALWWQCSPLHPWLLVPAPGTEGTSPGGDAAVSGTLCPTALPLNTDLILSFWVLTGLIQRPRSVPWLAKPHGKFCHWQPQGQLGVR